MVPEGWKKGTLKDSLEEIHQGLNTAAEKLKYSDEGWPILQTKHIVSGVIDASGARKVSDPDFELYRGKYQPRKNSILFSNIGTIGKSCLVKEDFEGLVAWNILYIKPKSDACVEFLFYYLQRHDEKGYFSSLVAGNAAKFINKTSMEGLQILYPPLPEQKKIARILSTWDQAITATERLLENSQQRKKGLMQQLLTGKKRLPGFEGEWEEIKLEQLIRESRKVKVDNPSEIELLTVKLHYKGVVPSGKYPNPTTNGRPYFRRNTGELIIGRQNIHNGGVGLVPPECDGLIASNAISSFEPRECADIRFILYLMSTDRFRFIVDNLSGGTGQKELSTRELLKLSIKVPSLAEQNAIAEVLCKADSEIQCISSLLGQLNSEKKALMQQLLTGKRRVNVETEAA